MSDARLRGDEMEEDGEGALRSGTRRMSRGGVEGGDTNSGPSIFGATVAVAEARDSPRVKPSDEEEGVRAHDDAVEKGEGGTEDAGVEQALEDAELDNDSVSSSIISPFHPR